MEDSRQREIGCSSQIIEKERKAQIAGRLSWKASMGIMRFGRTGCGADREVGGLRGSKRYLDRRGLQFARDCRYLIVASGEIVDGIRAFGIRHGGE